MKFVDDYLQKQKQSYPVKGLIKNVHFQYETEKRFFSNGKEKRDKIDIIIDNIGLQKYWKTEVDENIYFAIECKALYDKSNNSEYVKDIQKFTQRKYVQLRLPFEGMIGFIIESSILFNKIVEDINHKLKTHKEINTISYLTNIEVYPTFNLSYLSEHLKHFNTTRFKIYHLLFDYTKMVTK